MPTEKVRMFLSYAHEDKTRVEGVYQELAKAGFEPWMDVKDLLPGQQWKRETTNALRDSDFILVFFSNRSVSKTGYVQREFKQALDRLQEIPEGKIFIIPIRLNDCQVPEGFGDIHYCDIFEEGGFEKVVRAIKSGQPAERPEQTKLAKEIKEDILRDVKIAALFSEAKEAISKEDWRLAINKLQGLLALDATHTRAKVSLSLAQQELDLADMYSQAKEEYDAHRWSQALACFREIQNLKAHYKDVDGLVRVIEHELQKEKEADKKKPETVKSKGKSDQKRRQQPSDRKNVWLESKIVWAVLVSVFVVVVVYFIPNKAKERTIIPPKTREQGVQQIEQKDSDIDEPVPHDGGEDKTEPTAQKTIEPSATQFTANDLREDVKPTIKDRGKELDKTSSQPITQRTKYSFRKTPKLLSESAVTSMLSEKGFYDAWQNKNGVGIEHRYEPKTINGDKVVIDHATGLTWQYSGSPNRMPHLETPKPLGFSPDTPLDYYLKQELNGKNYAGHRDWRLPTLEEAMSLMEPTKNKVGLFINPIFDQTQTRIWTADKDYLFEWVVGFNGGFCSVIFGSYDVHYVRAVR